MNPERNQEAAWRWARRGAMIVASLVLLATLLVLVLRQQWSQHAREVDAWYAEHVGPLEMEEYLREPVLPQDNLALAVDAIARDAFFESEAASAADTVGRKLRGVGEFDVSFIADAPVTAAEMEGLHAAFDTRAELVSRMDGLGALTQTRRARPEAEDGVDPLLGVLRASGFRAAQAALLMYNGECAAAGQTLVAVERMAATLVGESHLLFSIIGAAVGNAFSGSVLRLVESQLEGNCRSQVDWPMLLEAVDHLQATTVPFGRVMAAEGAGAKALMAKTMAESEPTRWERLLGPNMFGLSSLVVASYGTWAQELRSDVADAASATPPRARVPARWFEQDVIAQILKPNLDFPVKSTAAVSATRLARYAITLAQCQQVERCDVAAIPLPGRFPAGPGPRVSVAGGEVEVSFMAPEPERWQIDQARGALRLRLPAAVAPLTPSAAER